jgi:Na+-translocating ferredoxin:NAD+ oxidoreductase RnfD subunit
MRALAFIANIGIIAAAYYFGSWTGMFIALAVCVVLVVGFLVFSTDKTEAEESRKTRKAMGRNTTFLAGLFGPSDR